MGSLLTSPPFMLRVSNDVLSVIACVSFVGILG